MNPKKTEVSIVQRAFWIGNLVYYQLVAVISVVLLWVMFDNNEFSDKFLWHISLGTGAYMPLMAVAIMSFSEDNLWTQKIPRHRRYWIHGVMLMISWAMVTAGICIEYHSKNGSNRPHFQSKHGFAGIWSWSLVTVSQITGLLLAANRSILPRFIRPVYLKFTHTLLGIAGFLAGIACFYLMLHHRRISKFLSADALVAIKWVTWVVAVWTVLPALKSLFLQLKSILPWSH